LPCPKWPRTVRWKQSRLHMTALHTAGRRLSKLYNVLCLPRGLPKQRCLSPESGQDTIAAACGSPQLVLCGHLRATVKRNECADGYTATQSLSNMHSTSLSASSSLSMRNACNHLQQPRPFLRPAPVVPAAASKRCLSKGLRRRFWPPAAKAVPRMCPSFRVQLSARVKSKSKSQIATTLAIFLAAASDCAEKRYLLAAQALLQLTAKLAQQANSLSSALANSTLLGYTNLQLQNKAGLSSQRALPS